MRRESWAAMPGRKDERTKKKDSQLVLRINADERDTFVRLCDALDTSASREIRRFMKRFVTEHGDEAEKK